MRWGSCRARRRPKGGNTGSDSSPVAACAALGLHLAASGKQLPTLVQQRSRITCNAAVWNMASCACAASVAMPNIQAPRFLPQLAHTIARRGARCLHTAKGCSSPPSPGWSSSRTTPSWRRSTTPSGTCCTSPAPERVTIFICPQYRRLQSFWTTCSRAMKSMSWMGLRSSPFGGGIGPTPDAVTAKENVGKPQNLTPFYSSKRLVASRSQASDAKVSGTIPDIRSAQGMSMPCGWG